MAGDNIIHVASIRLRIVGVGNLIPTLYGFDKIYSTTLASISLSATNAKIATRLANFNSQGVILRIETQQIDEQMKVNDITVFVKPIYSEYPA